MKTKTEKIPVFFTIDDNYAPLLGVALRSLIDNADKNRQYKIYIIHQGLSAENRAFLEQMAVEPFEFEFVEMAESLEGIENREENLLRCDYFTATIYYRLFLPDMFPQFDKAVYLDSDIVVPGDISELYDMQLGDNLIAACPDWSIQEVPELVRYVENAVGVNESREYINSGVLVMNMAKMRECKFLEHFLTLLNKWHFKSIAPDQDYLNAICLNRKLFLPEHWDAMPNRNKRPLGNPKLIHYNLFEKPWCYDGVQYEDYFWKIAEKTPFISHLRKFKENYSESQKKHDMESMQFLVRQGGILADAAISFNNISKTEGGIAL